MDLSACVKSFLGPKANVKFVVDGDDETEAICCPAQYFALLPHDNSLCQFINSTLQSHHEKHLNGTTTLLAYIYLFHRCLTDDVKQGKSVIHAIKLLRSSAERLIDFMRNSSFSLKSILSLNFDANLSTTSVKLNSQLPNTKLCTGRILKQSRHFQENEGIDDDVSLEAKESCVLDFPILSDETLKRMEEIVKRVNHGDEELVPFILESWINHVKKKSQRQKSLDFSYDVDNVQVLSLIGNFSSTCIISGILIPIDKTLHFYLENKNKKWSGLFINGSLKHDFKHRGYKQTNRCQVVKISAQMQFHDPLTTDQWNAQVVNKLRELRVNVVFVQGSIEDKLRDLCLSASILPVENLNYKLFSTICQVLTIPADVYILNCSQKNVIEGIKMEQWNTNDMNDKNSFVKIKIPILFQTIVISSSCFPQLCLREHRAKHFIHRLASCLTRAIEGGGEAEKKYLTSLLQENFNNSPMREVLKDFITFLEESCDVQKPVDALQPKIEAIRSAVYAASLIATTDSIVILGDLQQVLRTVERLPYQLVGTI